MSRKLLLLSHKFFPFIGGIERHSEILAFAFYEAGYDVHVLTWTEHTEQNKFPFQVIRNPNLFQLWKEHAWADIIFENNPCIRLSWPKLLFRRPNFIALHTWITDTNGAIRFQDRLKKIWLKKANRVISCSKAIQKASWPSSIVINNPYDDSVFNIIPGSERNKDFVFLGRLVSNKGVDLALKLIHNLKIKVGKEKVVELKTTLTIIGEGPEKENLKDLVKDLGLEDRVEFMGALKGKALVQSLNQHRYLLVPSKWEEPFGMVALEGMACGCIPIVSNSGGLPDAVGNAGVLFKTNCAEALLETTTELISDQTLQAQLKAAAPQQLSKHKKDLVTRQYLDLVETEIQTNCFK